MATSIPPTLVPVAPGEPAPIAAPTGPAKSATTLASERARATIEAGQPIAATPPAAPAAPPAGGPAAPAAPAAAPAAPGTPAAPKAAEGQPAPKPGEQQPKAGEEPAPPAEGEENPLAVEIPLGDTDEETLVINAATPEMAQEIREIVEIAVEAKALSEENESLRTTVTQAEEMREYADADPIGFTLNMIGTDLNTAKALTMFLLTQPSLYAAVKDDLAKLADPMQFKVLASDARDTRYTMTEQANERIETSRVVRQNLQDVQATVNAMLPENLTPAQRQVAYRDCLRDLKDFADSKELVVLPVHQIPGLLAARLSALGIDPEEAAARATVAAARNGGPTRTPRLPRAAATPTPPARPAAVPAPKKDGSAFVASANKKREAAAIPPAGAGSPSNPGGLQAPRGPNGEKLGIKETLDWHRQRRAKGVRLW